jgi:threonyl-tRNA synthetase
MAIVIEHTAGAFPVWLAPVQIAIIPISEKHIAYASELSEKFYASGFRFQMMADNETLGKKIRQAEMQKIPYLVILGDKEIAAGAVSVRGRGTGDLGQMPIQDFIEKVKGEIEHKS